MKHLQIAILVAVSFAILSGTADAQKKRVRKSSVKKPTVVKTVVPTLDVRVAREKVDTQLSNVNQFVDVLGPIAQSIETLDASASAKRLPQSTIDKNDSNKKKVVEAIRNLKAGLAALESEFRTKPDLKKYLVNIEGITDLASRAEDSAIAGKFVASKEPLRDVAQKLTDTLAVIPR